MLALVSVTMAQQPAVTTAPAQPAPVVVTAKPEPYLVIPEPRSMRSAISGSIGGSQLTILTPAKDLKGDGKLTSYSTDEFQKLGISWDSFLTRAKTAANNRLATLQPELIKDKSGRVRYAVYRGAESFYAGLIIAPSLPKIFEKVFGPEVWLAAPDRNALYVFPANAPVVDDFAADLEERFQTNPYSASEEVFSMKADGELRVIGNFTDR